MTTNQDIEKLEASQPFLGDSGSNCSDEQQPQSSIPIRRKQNSLFLKRYGVLMHILLIASYSIAFWYAGWKWKLSSRPGELLPLPAREAVHWELRPFTTSLIDNPFTGEPRPELEHAWHNLVSNDHIKVAHSTLQALNLKSVELKDGSGDVASLGTFHALHCLKKIRHMTYKDHYHHGKDTVAMIREQAHSDHCIEYIREYLMCKPDLSLVTFHFINNTAQHADDPSLQLPTSWDHSLHECANWDSLNNWAGERVFDLYQNDLLRQPKHGLAYEERSD